MSYKDWIKQVEYGVKELSKKTDKIYIGGFSTGSTLAINYVLSNPLNEIAGIVLLSPAINLDVVASLAPIVKYFNKYLNVYEDTDVVKYESFATNAAAQVYLLTKQYSVKKHKNIYCTDLRRSNNQPQGNFKYNTGKHSS